MFVPVVPNWTQAPRATYAFSTPVFAAHEGTEYRAAGRTTARRTLEFATWPEQYRNVKDLILRRVSVEPYRIADWSQPETRTTTPFEPGQMFLEVTHVPDWLRPGARVALVHKRHATEMVVAQVTNEPPSSGFPYSLSPSIPFEEPVLQGFPYPLPMRFGAGVPSLHTYIVFTLPSGRSWPVGTQVLPVALGFFDQASFAAVTDSVLPGQVRFAVLPASELPPAPMADPGLNGREAFVFKPDWSSPPQIEYPDPREFVDYGRGRIAVFDPVDFVARVSSATYRCHEAETRRIVAFFQRMKGRRGEFYRPSWTKDMTLAASVPPAGQTVKIDGAAYAVQYGNLKTYPAIAIHWIDGRVQLAYLEGIEAKPNDQTWLKVAGTAFPTGMTPAQISHISWVSLCRFAADEITVVWKTRDWAEILCSFTEMPEIEPDAGQGLLDNASLWLLAMYGETFVVNVMADPLQRIVNVDYPRAVANAA